MKYIKLFEQDEWWLKAKDCGIKPPPENIDGLVLISGDGDYYISESIKDYRIINLYNGYVYINSIGSGFNITMKENLNEDNDVRLWNGTEWNSRKYKNLPQEIKNKLIWTI